MSIAVLAALLVLTAATPDGAAAERPAGESPAIDSLAAGDHVRSLLVDGRERSYRVLIKTEGGGHTWPGRDLHLRWLGRTTADVVANDLIWEFFKRHPMAE
jgi:hypothetical protein